MKKKRYIQVVSKGGILEKKENIRKIDDKLFKKIIDELKNKNIELIPLSYKNKNKKNENFLYKWDKNNDLFLFKKFQRSHEGWKTEKLRIRISKKEIENLSEYLSETKNFFLISLYNAEDKTLFIISEINSKLKTLTNIKSDTRLLSLNEEVFEKFYHYNEPTKKTINDIEYYVFNSNNIFSFFWDYESFFSNVYQSDEKNKFINLESKSSQNKIKKLDKISFNETFKIEEIEKITNETIGEIGEYIFNRKMSKKNNQIIWKSKDQHKSPYDFYINKKYYEIKTSKDISNSFIISRQELEFMENNKNWFLVKINLKYFFKKCEWKNIKNFYELDKCIDDFDFNFIIKSKDEILGYKKEIISYRIKIE